MLEYVDIDIKNYHEKQSNFQNEILKYLDEEKCNEDDINIQKYFDENLIPVNGFDVKKIFCLLRSIINNHHRSNNFFNKLEKIIIYFKEDFKQAFTNSELFDFFSQNKIILLILMKNNILEVDQSIVDILKMRWDMQYFWPEILQFNYDKPLEFNNIEYSIYLQKRELGENDHLLAELIRNDSIEEFIEYYNKENIPLNATISRSLYETNSLLIENDPTIAEYAAFFGSIKILIHLKITNDQLLTSSLWI